MNREKIPQKSLDFSQLKGWAALATSERNAVTREHAALTGSIERLGKSWIEVGTHLKTIRDVLEPHGMFGRYLKLSPFGLSRATAYRRIKVAEKARRYLNPNLFRFALLSGLDNISVESIKAVPPPASQEPAAMRQYLKSVSGKERNGRKNAGTHTSAALGYSAGSIANRNEESIPFDPEIMKKECINFARSRYEKLPLAWPSRQRGEWARSLCGMILTMAGMGSERRVPPEAIPIDWMGKVG